uniref:Uncharacterized protein n=1 Tax=Quercus lobata TaxID=97700 RepID=A0A7N2L6F0_QUELO
MEVKSRKPFFFNKALLEHREQVLQRQCLAPPCVLPVHKSLPFIGFCSRRYLEAVVYELNPLDTVHNLATTGGPEEGGFEVTYHDVFPFGVVLLGLITKRIVDRENILKTTLVYRWAWRQYRPNRYLVHESLVEDPGFYASDGIMITELAMRCIQRELISVLP